MERDLIERWLPYALAAGAAAFRRWGLQDRDDWRQEAVVALLLAARQWLLLPALYGDFRPYLAAFLARRLAWQARRAIKWNRAPAGAVEADAFPARPPLSQAERLDRAIAGLSLVDRELIGTQVLADRPGNARGGPRSTRLGLHALAKIYRRRTSWVAARLAQVRERLRRLLEDVP